LILLSKIYSFLAKFHRSLYESGLLKKTKISKPVFSVGNLSMGGTGKTPLTLFLYDELVKKNKKPAIICRSYKAQLRNSQVVPEAADPSVYGDEAVFYKTKRPKATVISGPVKAESALVADQLKDVDVIIVDDGFQHHKLYKNWNSVVIDLSVAASENRVLPLGRFRESWEALKYANALFFSRSENSIGSETEKRATAEAIQVPKFKLESQLSVSIQPHKKYLLISAIGHPQQFSDQMRRQFSDSEFLELRFPDHYSFSQDDIQNIENKVVAESFTQALCTEKDFVKINRLGVNPLIWQSVKQQSQVTPSGDWDRYFDKKCQELLT